MDGPKEKMLIQCCCSLEKDKTRERELRALREAAAEMPGSRCLIVTWLEDDAVAGVRVLPYWKWALATGTQ